MLNSHLIRCRLGSVVLIKVDSEVDSAANSMLLPKGVWWDTAAQSIHNLYCQI